MEQPLAKKKNGPEIIQNEYEIKRWADTVMEAHEIMQDPKKMKFIAPLLKQKKAALENVPVASLSDIKKKANQAEELEDEGEE